MESHTESCHSQSSQEQLETPVQSWRSRIITDPYQYLEWCKKDKKIKIMDQMNPILNNVYLKDISLHKKGPMEDKIYSKTPKYYWNIRRGNTLCEIYQNQVRTDLFFCRRGMIKFFDLEPKFLQLNKTYLTFRESRFRSVIFRELDQDLTQGNCKFHLYALFKENGQHCQIAYQSKLDCWIVASKNVSILVRSQEDIEAYKKKRFYWASLIAAEFLKSIKAMSPQTLAQFKQDIQNKTLIGQHCGYQKHQHITTYTQVQIIYYAVVENTGDQSCLPVDQAFSLFDKYNLRKVKAQVHTNLVNKTEVYEKMYELLKATAKGPIDVVGQGSVLYIVAQKDGLQRTISLSKLKSVEYLIFRKLREMLKINLSKKGETANTLEKFKFDVEQIVRELFEPPYPLSYYYKVAEKAFKEVGQKFEDMEEGELRYKFVTFLQNVLANKDQVPEAQIHTKQEQQGLYNKIVILCVPKTLQDGFQKAQRERGIQLEEGFRQGAETNKQTVYVTHMVPRVSEPSKHSRTLFVVCDYTEAEQQQVVTLLNQEQQPYNQSIVSFIRAADKQKQISLLCNRISAFAKLCEQNGLNIKHVGGKDKDRQIRSIIESEFCGQKSTTTTPKRYILIPLVLPGSGKTLLAQGLTKSNLDVEILQTDSIRRQVFTELKQQDSSLTSQELFKLAKEQTKSRYLQRIREALATPLKQSRFIFLDRVFTPNNLESLDAFKDPQNLFVFIIQGGQPWRVENAQYFMSLTYMLNCFRRSVDREGHQILETDPITTAKVIMKFYQMFRNWKPNLLEKRYPGSRVVKLQFVEDRPEDDETLSNQLKSKVKQCLKHTVLGFQNSQSLAFNQFVQIYYASTISVRDVDPTSTVASLTSQLQHLR